MLHRPSTNCKTCAITVGRKVPGEDAWTCAEGCLKLIASFHGCQASTSRHLQIVWNQERLAPFKCVLSTSVRNWPFDTELPSQDPLPSESAGMRPVLCEPLLVESAVTQPTVPRIRKPLQVENAVTQPVVPGIQEPVQAEGTDREARRATASK